MIIEWLFFLDNATNELYILFSMPGSLQASHGPIGIIQSPTRRVGEVLMAVLVLVLLYTGQARYYAIKETRFVFFWSTVLCFFLTFGEPLFLFFCSEPIFHVFMLTVWQIDWKITAGMDENSILNNSVCKNALLLVMLRWGVKIRKRFENNLQFRCRELPPKTPNLVVILRLLMVAGSTFHPFI